MKSKFSNKFQQNSHIIIDFLSYHAKKAKLKKYHNISNCGSPKFYTFLPFLKKYLTNNTKILQQIYSCPKKGKISNEVERDCRTVGDVQVCG
jgi:hypothetical protein